MLCYGFLQDTYIVFHFLPSLQRTKCDPLLYLIHVLTFKVAFIDKIPIHLVLNFFIRPSFATINHLMSFPSSTPTASHRPPFTLPQKPTSQTLTALFEELELIDMTLEAPSVYPSHKPQPPSPPITFAPTCPLLSPVNLTSANPSLHTDLDFPLKPFTKIQPTDLTTSMPPSLHATPIHKVIRYPDLEAGHPTPAKDNYNENDLEACMPAGWPYRSWRDYGWLAWEWMRNMQSLLMNLMEQEHRLGGARHTI
ncbi:MAG: hypothetical protein LQ339_003893 [Xanthoria mediterranea]|nr:MAG: hypothetical protein LQ339_003893 [Xanthoria mediterranea]